MDDILQTCRTGRKSFSRIGISLSVMIVAAVVIQAMWFLVPEWIWGENCDLLNSSHWLWLGSMVPMYLVAMPLGMLMMRKVPAQPPEPAKFGGKRFVIILPIMFFLTYSGNFLGQGIASLLSGGMAENALDTYLMEESPLKVIVLVVMAPLLEELVFRKLLIDRVRCFGEKTAVLLSGLTFGLFHMNLFQFFYAFGVGILFAYIYVRTGKVRNTMLLHGLLNVIGGVIAPAILMFMQSDMMLNPESYSLYVQMWTLLLMLLCLAFLLALIGLFIAGLVLLIVFFRKSVWKEAVMQLPKGQVFRTAYWNVGMVIFLLFSIGMTMYSVLA